MEAKRFKEVRKFSDRSGAVEFYRVFEGNSETPLTDGVIEVPIDTPLCDWTQMPIVRNSPLGG
jgi:hypothetical protein